MKKLLIVLSSFLLIISCTKEVHQSVSKRELIIEKDDVKMYGMNRFNKTLRSPNFSDSLNVLYKKNNNQAGSGNTKRDSDRDGIPDITDNCPTTSNANQLDSDGDGIGDVCDPTPYPPPAPRAKVILLDFDGHYVANTMWNANGPFQCNPANLTLEEQANILTHVQTQWAAYNVVITTDEAVYQAGDPLNRRRVVVTESYQWYGSGVGGVAYINSFTWGDESPAFVFSSLLGYNIHNIAEACSHESGHTIGLRHQVTCENGVITSDYNWGYINPNTGIFEAPIMGASYNVEYGIWIVGPNSLGCNVTQNDPAILTSKLGLK